LHLNLGHFVVFCFFGFFFFFFLGFFPFDETTTELLLRPSPGLEAEELKPKLLSLKLYCIWTWRFFFQSSLCLSNAYLAHY
jgi:hypothetical protein